MHSRTHTMSLGDLTKFEKSPIIIKEGVQYRIKIVFRVQREIVSGLRYFQATYRKGIRSKQYSAVTMVMSLGYSEVIWHKS